MTSAGCGRSLSRASGEGDRAPDRLLETFGRRPRIEPKFWSSPATDASATTSP
jgi:hypothetical protein